VTHPFNIVTQSLKTGTRIVHAAFWPPKPPNTVPHSLDIRVPLLPRTLYLEEVDLAWPALPYSSTVLVQYCTQQCRHTVLYTYINVQMSPAMGLVPALSKGTRSFYYEPGSPQYSTDSEAGIGNEHSHDTGTQMFTASKCCTAQRQKNQPPTKQEGQLQVRGGCVVHSEPDTYSTIFSIVLRHPLGSSHCTNLV